MTGSPEPERGESGVGVKVEGRVAFREVLEGSRAEREAAVVVADDGRVYRVHLEGDQPFEQPAWRSLVGRRVVLSGTWRNGVVRVDAAGLEVAP